MARRKGREISSWKDRTGDKQERREGKKVSSRLVIREEEEEEKKHGNWIDDKDSAILEPSCHNRLNQSIVLAFKYRQASFVFVPRYYLMNIEKSD